MTSERIVCSIDSFFIFVYEHNNILYLINFKCCFYSFLEQSSLCVFMAALPACSFFSCSHYSFEILLASLVMYKDIILASLCSTLILEYTKYVNVH